MVNMCLLSHNIIPRCLRKSSPMQLTIYQREKVRNDATPIIAGPLQMTTVIDYGPDSFAVQSQPKYSLRLSESAGLEPLTCLHLLPKDTTTTARALEKLRKTYSEYLRADDVFCQSFLRNILLVSDGGQIEDSVLKLLTSWGCLIIFKVPSHHGVAPGPFFFSRDGIFWAWKLYADCQEAFVLSTIPSQKDPSVYEHLNASAFGTQSLCVAVPSRLYFTKTPQMPLAGMRIAIKDLYELNGVHTGCGNRAYRRLYPASSTTAPDVQALIDKGAVIIGKTKTVEFGGSQEVVGDWVDYSYAFNARGDGYLASTGSSTGSASSLAAYPWIDITLGTDAGGSIRDPAVAQGVYGFRPSHNGSSTPGVALASSIFHTPGFLGRSSESMLSFGQLWLESSASKSRNSEIKSLHPSQVLFPSDYYADREDVQLIAQNWVSAFSSWLGAKLITVGINEKWQETKPHNINGSFSEVFNKTFIDVLSNEFYNYSGSFRKDYRDQFSSEPYVCKVTEWLWNKGSSITLARKKEALAEVQTHNTWFKKFIFGNDNTIMIAPRYKLDYRDEYLPPPPCRDYYGFDSNLHASLAGFPDLIVPIGQCRYWSHVTQKDEVFPVSLSIMARKGTDNDLLKLIHDFLSTSKLPTDVLTGRAAFSLESEANSPTSTVFSEKEKCEV